MFVKEKRKNIQYIELKNVTEKVVKSLEITNKLCQISLRKSPIGLGFTLGTMESKIKDQNEIFVKMILDFSPAKCDGRLKVGDRIKKINNLDVRSMTQTDLVRIIRSIPIGEVIGLTVLRSTMPNDEHEILSHEPILMEISQEKDKNPKLPEESKSKMFHFIIAVSNDIDKTCYLQVSAGVLGISVECREDNCREIQQFPDNIASCDNQKSPNSNQKQFHIKSILKNGSAHQDGRLKIGDEILAIQGIDVQNGKIFIPNSKLEIFGDIFHFDLASVFIRNLDKLSKLSEFKKQFRSLTENSLQSLKLLIKEAGEMYSSISVVIKRHVSEKIAKIEEDLIHQSFDTGKKKLNDLYRIENIFELNPDYRSNYNDHRHRDNRYKDEEFNEIHGRFHQERFIQHRNSDSYDDDSGFGWSLENFYIDDYENEKSLVDLNSNNKDDLFDYFSKDDENIDDCNENCPTDTPDVSDHFSYDQCEDIA